MEEICLKKLVFALCCVPCLASVVQISAGRISDAPAVEIKPRKASANYPGLRSGKKLPTTWNLVEMAELKRRHAGLLIEVTRHQAEVTRHQALENRLRKTIEDARRTIEIMGHQKDGLLGQYHELHQELVRIRRTTYGALNQARRSRVLYPPKPAERTWTA